jgi:hypothetical protein
MSQHHLAEKEKIDMNKLFIWAAGTLMSLLLITAVNAAPPTNSLPEIQPQTNDNQNTGNVADSGLSPNNFLGYQVDDTMNQDTQITQPKAGISWREQVIKERVIMRRAAEMRNANMRNALMGKQEQIKGLSVDSYNDLILQRNEALVK